MASIDWHADRNPLSWSGLLELAPESEGIDLVAVRSYRLGRVRQQMAAHQVAALVLSDPVSIRYATGTRNMQVFTARNSPSRYLVLTADRSILFEFTGCEHLAAGFETVDEVRPALTASFVAAGPGIADQERRWASETAALLSELVGPGETVGIERMNAGAAMALADAGFHLIDAQECLELARCIKSADEVRCIEASLRATERAVKALEEGLEPGLTEVELWSILHRSVIAQNGDYCETRLLSAGRRTNPWFQEAANHRIEPNVLVALDTDVVGCHGYYSDFSRTFHAGPGKPSVEQRELYRLAHEQVSHNMALLKPGLSFADYADRAWDIPERYRANRYYLSAHGNGMTGEYPYLYHRDDFADAGYDGEIQAGMTLCVESYIGAEGGDEGVKLEQQVLITEEGVELLSLYPFDEALLG